MKNGERPAIREEDSSGSENTLGAPSTAAFSTLLAERDEFKSRCRALLLENQCIPRLVKEAKETGERVAAIEKLSTLAKSSPTIERNEKLSVVAEKRVITLEAELKVAQDAQKKSVDAAVKSKKHANDAAAELPDSVQHVTKVKKNARLAIKKLTDTIRQATRSAETAEETLRRLI